MPEDRHSGVPGGNGSGADVKSGVIPDVNDDSAASVTFNTAFSSAPSVTLTLLRANQVTDTPILTAAPSTTGFNMRINKGHGGSAHTWDVAWIATDAGDP